MSATNKVTVDLVTTREDGTYVLILVEVGPWDNSNTDDELRRVQDRLYNCIDAFLDGKVSDKYPDSAGQNGVIRLDCYDLPVETVDGFWRRFTSFIDSSDEYQSDIEQSDVISGLTFEISHGTLKPSTEQNAAGQPATRSESK